MASSGIRIGAWDSLQWKHISPIYSESGQVIAAKIIVYAGDAEEYYSFITPEAYLSLKEWMDFRKSYGEKINGESWVMRDLWQTTNVKYGAKWGLAAYPKKLKSSGVKRIIERSLWEQGLRQHLKNNKKRHEWKAAHGLRKFYKTRRRKTSEIIVDSDEIVIRVPYSKPDTEIKSLIKEKISWILMKQKEIADSGKKIEISKPVYTKDSSLPYLGKNHKIQVKILDSQKENNRKVEKNSVKYKNGVLVFNIQPLLILSLARLAHSGLIHLMKIYGCSTNKHSNLPSRKN